MRAGGLVGDEAPAVKRRAGTHAIRYGGSGPHHQWAAHAVALRADLLRGVHRLLCVEKGDERHRVALSRALRSDTGHQRP